MSVQAMSWVLDESEAKLGARLILLAIANHADTYGENCYASVRTLAEAARLSERQTRVSLRMLERDGEIEEVGRHPKHGTHVYRLPKMAAQTFLVGGADSAPAISAPGRIRPSGGQNLSARGARTAPEPSENRPEPTTAAGKRPRPLDPIWDGFAEWMGSEPQTKAERGKWNAAAKQLRDIGAGDAREIVRRGRLYLTRYKVAPTPWGLVAHWGEFQPVQTVQRIRPRIQDMTDEELVADGR